jgi:hypothetical protein
VSAAASSQDDQVAGVDELIAEPHVARREAAGEVLERSVLPQHLVHGLTHAAAAAAQ